MSAISDAKKLAEQGLTYWAPGPTAASIWATDPNGRIILVSRKNGAPIRRDTYDDMSRMPGARPVFNVGAYLIGFEVPLVGHDSDPVTLIEQPELVVREWHPEGACWLRHIFGEKVAREMHVHPAVSIETKLAAATKAQAALTKAPGMLISTYRHYCDQYKWLIEALEAQRGRIK